MSAHSYFLTPPNGFYNNINLMIEWDTNSFSNLLNEIIESIHSKSFNLNIKHYANVTQFNEDKVESVINAITYILHGAAIHNLSDDEFNNVLINQLCLPESIIKHLNKVWSKYNENNKLKDVGLRGSRLVGLDWKLGVGIASDACINLRSPFVGLTFHIIDSDSTHRSHYMELSISDFQKLSNNFDAVAKQLELV